MNRYAALAQEYWQANRADEVAAMTNSEKFFAQLGEQISYQVAERARDLRLDGPAGEPYPEKMARFNRARQLAEQQILHETLIPPSD